MSWPPATMYRPSGDIANCTSVCTGPSRSMGRRHRATVRLRDSLPFEHLGDGPRPGIQRRDRVGILVAEVQEPAVRSENGMPRSRIDSN